MEELNQIDARMNLTTRSLFSGPFLLQSTIDPIKMESANNMRAINSGDGVTIDYLPLLKGMLDDARES